MGFVLPGLVALLLVTAGLLVGAPPLVRGLRRRGSGTRYERRFLVQRGGQLVGGAIVVLDLVAVLAPPNVVGSAGPLSCVLSAAVCLPPHLALTLSWVGVALVASGMGFVVAGWYALGDSFSTDAEILERQRVRCTGPYRFVMHPVYSGCVQAILGISLAMLSPIGVLLSCAVFVPLSLMRGRYEESLLIEQFGEEYAAYARALRWRRLVPRLVPLSSRVTGEHS